jgi:carboxyl-terminal processing protease
MYRLIAATLIVAALLGSCARVPAAPAPAAAVSTRPPARPTASATPSAVPTVAPTPTAWPTIAPTATLVPLSSSERVAIFDQLWQTVNDNYLYRDFNGVDWVALRDPYRARAAAADDTAAFYAVLRELIDSLADDHSRFETPQEVAEQRAEAEGTLQYGGIGVNVRELDEGGLITRVLADGPAARAGLQPGDLIVAVNGREYTDSAAFGPDGPLGEVRGQPGRAVEISLLRDGQRRTVSVIREIIDINRFNQITITRLAGDVAVLEIPSFYLDTVDTQVEQALQQLAAEQPLRALIIDLRTNGGGYVYQMRNVLGLFIDGGSIGSTAGRDRREDQQIPAGRVLAAYRDLPIAVLIGPDTVSAAEMFAAGIRVRERALLVGQPTAGNTENLYAYSFTDGSRLLLAEVAFFLPDGSMIEGSGMPPDRLDQSEWWRFPLEKDPQVQTALRALGIESADTARLPAQLR